MIVYVYDVKTNEKKLSNKHVTAIVSTPKAFIITDSDGTTVVDKVNVKLVVYGF